MENDSQRWMTSFNEIQEWILPRTLISYRGTEFASDPQQVIDSIVTAYEELIDNTPDGLQYLTPFHRFQSIDEAGFFRIVQEFLNNMYTITYKNYDAVRYVENVALTVPSKFKHPLFPRARWCANIEVACGTHLGDGTAVYSSSEKKWEFTQRKGRYNNTARLITRQLFP